MKIFMIIVGIFMVSSIVDAGGDFSTSVPQTIKNESNICKTNKVYTEKDAKLMWQDQAYTDIETGAYNRNHSVAKAGTWNHALNYCNTLNYQGYSDWRLPTSDELRQVHHKAGQVFSYHTVGDFWTSTPASDNRYYVVYPTDAYQYKRKKKETNYIRCVRCWIPVEKDTLYDIIQKTANNLQERNN